MMLLRSPQFGSSRNILTFETTKRTTHDQISQVRPRSDRRDEWSLTFEALTAAEKDELIEFLTTNQAKRVLLKDINGVEWFGFVISPEIEFTRTHTNPCDLWSCTFDFEGEINV